MKAEKILSIFILLAIFSISGCDLITHINETEENDRMSVTGSGQIVTIDEPFTNFNSISLSHSFNATVVKSSNYYVRLNVDDNIIDYLHTYVEGDILYLGLLSGSYNNVNLIAEIGMPDIGAVYMSGATKINLDGFEFVHPLNINASGASVVYGNIVTGDVHINLSGASVAELIGKCKNLYICCSGAGSLNLYNFPCENANIELSGASIATINSSGIMNINVSGVSTLNYTGNPTIGVIDISGLSHITRIN